MEYCSSDIPFLLELIVKCSISMQEVNLIMIQLLRRRMNEGNRNKTKIHGEGKLQRYADGKLRGTLIFR